jgi:type VI secretion system secreted protein VgrG
MPPYSQANRALQVTTPLGDDALLVVGFRGTEELSSLFSFELSLIAENSTTVDFSKLVGHDISLSVATTAEGGASDWRYLSGICARFSQGNRNEEFTSYYAEVVPKVWLLTRRAQIRIFQQKSVPDILKEVLKGFDCDFQLRGHYEPREYCVQYRETDFDFASRLMEEEGIYYFFEHSKSGHKMIIADTPQSHSNVPGLTKVKYEVVEGGQAQGDHIFEWRKTQELRAAKYALWDHSFQQPKQNLEAKESIMESVKAGTVTHKLKGQPNDPLEIYDFPGGYAVRFDGINPSGGAQSERLQKILEDNKRTVKLRMEAEALPSLTIHGSSGCRNFVAGHKFTLERHFDANGDYVLLSVTHEASMGTPYRSGSISGDLVYSNIFTCIPSQLPYRPPRRTPKPFVHGVQNAIVTGPSGDEIFTDKYGRVKVQFYWDRAGKKDANSSCWLRVSTSWAGKQWGFIQIPRIGQEVIVAFVEGNPDEPVIVGSVWNPETMPTFTLPDSKTRSGIQSCSTKGGGAANFNEISFEDKKGSEQLYIHAEKNQDIVVENDKTENVGHDETIKIGNNRIETVVANETLTVNQNRTRNVGQNENVTVALMRTHTVGVNEAVTIGAAQEVTIGAVQTNTIGADQINTIGNDQTNNIANNRNEDVGQDEQVNIGQNRSHSISENDQLSVGKELSVTAGDSITLTTGKASITMKKDGTIIIKGKDITIEGSGEIDAKASKNITMKGQKILQN